MNRRKSLYTTFAVLAALSINIFAQDAAPKVNDSPPDLGIPAEIVPVGQYVTLKPKTEAKAITYIGMSGVEPIPSSFLSDARWFLLDTRGLAAGTYQFQAVGSLNDVHTRVAFRVVIGNNPTPIPNPDVDPTPNPTPTPNPLPDVDPNDPDASTQAVIGGDGFRVMFVWEDENRAKLPREQLNTIIGTPLAKYVTEHAAKMPDGRADWWLLDDDYTDDQIARLPAYWQQPYKDAVVKFRRSERPAIVLSNNAKKTKPKATLTYVPLKHADTMALLKRYAEN